MTLPVGTHMCVDFLDSALVLLCVWAASSMLVHRGHVSSSIVSSALLLVVVFCFHCWIAFCVGSWLLLD